jgi:hypothetical protein
MLIYHSMCANLNNNKGGNMKNILEKCQELLDEINQLPQDEQEIANEFLGEWIDLPEALKKAEAVSDQNTNRKD